MKAQTLDPKPADHRVTPTFGPLFPYGPIIRPGVPMPTLVTGAGTTRLQERSG